MLVIHFNTARMYQDLGNYHVALKHTERSLSNARSTFGCDDRRVKKVQDYIAKLRLRLSLILAHLFQM